MINKEISVLKLILEKFQIRGESDAYDRYILTHYDEKYIDSQTTFLLYYKYSKNIIIL